MTSTRLWRALNAPPTRHPHFRRRVLLALVRATGHGWSGLLLVTLHGLGVWLPVLLLAAVPLLLLINGLAYGSEISFRIAHAGAREHEQGTFSLLAVAPVGKLGACWALAATTLYMGWGFPHIQMLLRRLLIGLGALVVFIGGFNVLMLTGFLQHWPLPELIESSGAVIRLLAMVIALYADFVQSVALAVILGIASMSVLHNRIEAGLAALALFLTTKVLGYVLSAYLAFTLLPAMMAELAPPVHTLALPLLQALTQIAIQESILSMVWRLMLRQMELSPSEAWATLTSI